MLPDVGLPDTHGISNLFLRLLRQTCLIFHGIECHNAAHHSTLPHSTRAAKIEELLGTGYCAPPNLFLAVSPCRIPSLFYFFYALLRAV